MNEPRYKIFTVVFKRRNTPELHPFEMHIHIYICKVMFYNINHSFMRKKSSHDTFWLSLAA